MVGTRTKWLVRESLRDVEIELSSAPVDAQTVETSLRELRSLVFASHRRDVASVLLDVHARIAGLPVSDLRSTRPSSRMADDLLHAARAGRLVALAREPKTPPVLDSATEEALGPSSGPPSTAGKTWFSLKVLDEVGDPVDGIDVAYSLGAQRRVATTNGAGVARLDGVDATTAATATVASLQQVRDKLQPRWKDQRAEKLPQVDHLYVRDIEELAPPVTVEAETPTTLVITPFFRCYEVDGAHFAFGRSFVLRDGIQKLAELAEVVEAKDAAGNPLDRHVLIMGHTDQSGTPELNKELSERRAKAVQALFAHDDAAWEDLFSNRRPGKYWSEAWGVWEAQHMLNTLGVTDTAGNALKETGVRDASTQQAIRKFRRGDDYPDRPAEQATLSDSPVLGLDGRKELFLAYAKRVTRHPVDKDRFVVVDGQPFVGCGVFNPLSMAAVDAESRRVVVFVFDQAKTPSSGDLPCKKGSVKPCPKATDKPVDPDGPPYRCPYFAKIAKGCPCQGGADLSHDLLVRVVLPLDKADALQHVLVLESDDGPDNGGTPTIVQKQALAKDARATDGGLTELHFTHVPDWHGYRLRVEGISSPYTVMDFTPYDEIHQRSGKVDTPLFPSLSQAFDPVLDPP